MARQVTLYIEDTEIKLLVTNNREVEKWASLLLEPGLVSDGVIIDQDLVAEKIKELLTLQQVKTRKVIAAVSGLNSIFRVISLPELPKALIPEAAKNEANRVIPLPLEQVYLSHQVIPSPVGETRIFLAAIPRNSTDALFRTMAKAGLSIYLLDIAPLALCRSADAPRAIVVNSWLSNVDIAIMVDRVPQVMRSLSLITESTSLEDKLPNIAEELNRTIAFYNSSHAEEPIDSSVPVFVCGDLAHEPDSWPSLVGELGSPVSVLPSPLPAPEAFDASQFMVNVGLSSKELLAETKEADFSIINLNAVPDEYIPRGISIMNIVAPVAAAAVIAALVYGWFYVQDIKVETGDLRTQLADLESQIAIERPTIAPLQTQIIQVGESIPPLGLTAASINTTFTGLRQNRAKVVEDIREALDLDRETPELWLTKISHDGATFIVEGTSPDESYIFEYARELRRSGRFQLVIVSSISSQEITEEEEEEVSEILNFKLILL